MWPHVTAWSEKYATLLLDVWLLTISHASVKFNITQKWIYDVFHLLYDLCDHMINRLYDFVDDRPTLEPTTLSRLVAMGLAEVEL